MSKVGFLFIFCAVVLAAAINAEAVWDPAANLVALWEFDDIQNPYKATIGPSGSQNGQPLMIVPGIVGTGSAYMGGVSSMNINNLTSLWPVWAGPQTTYSFWMFGDTSLSFNSLESCAFQVDSGDSTHPFIGSFINFLPHIGPNGAFCWLNSYMTSEQLIYHGQPNQFKDEVHMFNNWVHVALTDNKAAGRKELYLNGQLIAFTQGSDSPVGGPLTRFTIGSRPRDPQVDYFQGMIDDFRIYNTALTSDQIAQLASVPEPAALLLISLGGLIVLRRKNK